MPFNHRSRKKSKSSNPQPNKNNLEPKPIIRKMTTTNSYNLPIKSEKTKDYDEKR